MANRLPDLTVLVDSREKTPWQFLQEDKIQGKIRILGSEIVTLDAGDYTIKGYEDKVRIERKRNFSELMGNMSPVANKERFHREMEKLRDIPHKYIIVESTLCSEVLGLSVCQMNFGPPLKKVVQWLLEIEMEYGVHTIFAGDCGRSIAKYIFNNVVRKYS